jgi:hypothetical protein
MPPTTIVSDSRRPLRWCRPWVVALLLVAQLVVVPTFAGDGAEASAPGAASEVDGTSLGDEFWLAFPSSLIEQQDPELSLFIAGPQAASGTVEVAGIGFSTGFTVTPGEVTTVPIPLDAMLPGADETSDLGVRVTADTDVAVYGLNQQLFITDAYLGLPVPALGTDHLVTAWPTSGQLRSQLAVVAVEDGTAVTITPSVDTGSRAAGEPYTVELDRGQTYQLQATRSGADLTGSEVTADVPIAVFAGHTCATIPPGFGFCDTLIQQMFPTSTWGASFVTVPFIDRAADTFRILAGTDGTTVAIDGELVATLDRGEFHQVVLDEAAHITASAPVHVSQFMHGSTYDAGRFGDPAVVPIPAAEQFLASYTVTTPATGFEDHAINLTVPTAAVGDITIDGDPVPAEAFSPIDGSGFSAAQVRVEPGSKVLAGPVPFGATMYGTNEDDSYAYPGGLSLSPVALVDSVEISLTGSTADIGTETCVLATVRDAAGGPLSNIRVDFTVTGNHPSSGFAFTRADGVASYCYTGTEVGEDEVTGAVGPRSDAATLTWSEPTVAPDPDGIVQSFWIHGPLFTVDEDGVETDVLGDLLEVLADDLGDAVRLFDDLEFVETPALAPVMVDADGNVRDDVDVVAGVLRGPGAPAGGAVMVVATPRPGGGNPGTRGRTAVRSGDRVQLNLSVLGNRLPPGSTLVTAPAYGETDPRPGEAPPTSPLDPLATLEDRFAPDPGTGEIAATIATVTDPAGVPTPAAIPGVIGSVEGEASDGSLVADLPAIDRMLEHFQNASIEQEVGMSAALAYFPTPLGILVSVFGLVSTGFIVADAVAEFSDYLDHVLGGGEPNTFVSGYAGSRGDPHHRTFDETGRGYSFQAVGEFVLARTDGFEVQQRTAPVGDLTEVSLNDVVAVRVGDQVIEVQARSTTFRLDGGELELSDLAREPIDLEDGGTLRREGGSVHVETGDGHAVQLRCGPTCGYVDVFLLPAERGAGDFEGLLGDNDGDPSNDRRDRDGTVRQQPLSFEEMHGSFADEWRVTAEESLFTYGPGEDIETFTDRDFPTEEVTVDTLPPAVRAAAEAVCAAAGLGDHDAWVFDTCVLDLGLTGDPCFVRSAQVEGVRFPMIGTEDDSGILPDDPVDPDDPGDPDDPDDPSDPDEPPVDEERCAGVTFSDVPLRHPHEPGICRVAGEGIALGFGDGTYRPDLSVSRGQLASFVVRSLEVAGAPVPPAPRAGYRDTDGSVHRDAIDRLTAVGIVEGFVADEVFRPAAPVTRDQMASYLVRALAWVEGATPVAAGGPHFEDTVGSVHAGNIDVAYELGLTIGTGPGTFAPRVPTTRGQTATFLDRALDVWEVADVR